jgi:hypothetical protein
MTRTRSLALSAIMLAMLSGCERPVRRIAALDGCYETVGSPDFMRPAVHWVFRMKAGKLIDRSGGLVSTVALGAFGPKPTKISFQPGIYLTDDEHKMSVVRQGGIISGWASPNLGRPTIILGDEDRTIVRPTSCG